MKRKYVIIVGHLNSGFAKFWCHDEFKPFIFLYVGRKSISINLIISHNVSKHLNKNDGVPTRRRNKIIGQQCLQHTIYKTRHLLLCWLMNKNYIINCHYDMKFGFGRNVNNLKPRINNISYIWWSILHTKNPKKLHVEPWTTVYLRPCLSAAIFNYSWPHLQPKSNSTIPSKIHKIIPQKNNLKMWHNFCPNHLHSINITFYIMSNICVFFSIQNSGEIQSNFLDYWDVLLSKR